MMHSQQAGFRRRSVPAAELVRNFAHWREVGSREPILVTHHGRETHVFMGIDRFRNIDDGNMTMPPTSGRVFELAAHIHQGLVLCDAVFRISFVNNPALTMTKRCNANLIGMTLWDAFPQLIGTLTETHIRHTLSSGEDSAADIPSPFRDESWLHVQTFTYSEGVALLIRDITDETHRLRLADVKAAILRAASLHGGISFVRVSSRGFVEQVEENFCRTVALPVERILRAPVSDLVELPARPQFRSTLEAVLRGEGDQTITTRFLTNAGTVAVVDASIVRLQGIYGTESAVILMTPHSPMRIA